MISTSRVDSALGCWTSTSYAPPHDDRLASVLKRVWLFTGTTVLQRERVFPDGTLEIIFQLDAQYRPVRDVPSEPFPVLSLGGLRTRAHTIEGPGRPVRVMGLALRPSGSFALLRTSLRDVTDLDLDLRDVMGRAASELAEVCADARDDAACVAAAVAWVSARVEGAPEAPAPVVRAVRQIEANGGDLTIAALETLEGRSRGRFGAAFVDCVGVTPKRFARIVRFRRALELLSESEVPLAAIAGEAGYYDQPHFTAEFRVHAGMTPQAFRRAQRFPNSVSLAEQIFQDEVATPA